LSDHRICNTVGHDKLERQSRAIKNDRKHLARVLKVHRTRKRNTWQLRRFGRCEQKDSVDQTVGRPTFIGRIDGDDNAPRGSFVTLDRQIAPLRLPPF